MIEESDGALRGRNIQSEEVVRILNSAENAPWL